MSTAGGEAATDGETFAGPAAKIPIDECWAAGWALLLTRFHRILPQIWLPALAIFLVDRSGLQGWLVSTGGVTGASGMLAFEAILYALIAAGAYEVAFGRFDRWTLVRIAIGAPELRLILATFIFWAVLCALMFGSLVFGARIIAYLQLRDVLIAPDPNLTVAQWYAQLGIGGWIAIFSPVVFALVVFTWFGARFALAFPAACSGDRISILDATHLTKRNTWHVIGLSLVVALSLAILFGGISSALGVSALSDVMQSAAPKSPTTIFSNPTAALTTAKSATWTGPLLRVAFGAIWQIVFAGALARAYKAGRAAKRVTASFGARAMVV